MSEALPKEALGTVIEALCAPAKNPHGFDSQAGRWREEALNASLPALLARTSAKRLRSRLLVHVDEKTPAALAAKGTVTAADLPAILRTRRVWAGLISALARNPGQVEAAIALLPRLADREVERVVRDWDPDRYTRAVGDAPAPPLPQALFDAVLEASLTPFAAYLLHPEPEEGWEAVSAFSNDWSLERGGHSGRTLHHIAHRVHNNPRLAGLAADRLHAATDALVTRGQLLSLSEKQADDYEFDGRVLRLAEDLALLSANPDRLAGDCAQLALLDQPAAVSPAPSRTLMRIIDSVDPDYDRPARLLERHSEHRRVQALAALAANPHTPHAAVSDVLHGLHPAELAWIAEKAGGPTGSWTRRRPFRLTRTKTTVCCGC
ncbi:hypothetical protein [Streptomyces sp. NPDC056154]|uniref:hypothetical protein n=1 Tax=unclassified Streptomyces TaxID=2593676 RepID=UPI0035D97C9F